MYAVLTDLSPLLYIFTNELILVRELMTFKLSFYLDRKSETLTLLPCQALILQGCMSTLKLLFLSFELSSSLSLTRPSTTYSVTHISVFYAGEQKYVFHVAEALAKTTVNQQLDSVS